MGSPCCVECRASERNVKDCRSGAAARRPAVETAPDPVVPAAIVADPIGAFENLLLALEACCPFVSEEGGARPPANREPVGALDLRNAARDAARALNRLKETRLKG